MPFSGFGPQAIPFFKALAFHQTKDWFDANRAIYDDEIKGPLGDLVEELAARFAKAKTPLKGDRKASLFRIHRDVRFAKDKSPYKTNAGAVLTRTGTKNDPGLIYIHVAADGCFVAAGFYQPEPEALARPRAASPPPASGSPSRTRWPGCARESCARRRRGRRWSPSSPTAASRSRTNMR